MRRSVSFLRSALLASFLVTVVGISLASAQTFTGGLRGAVRDSSGVIPGVDVTLVNEGTSASRSTTTNESGEYSFPAITAGAYTVRVSLVGFKSFERRGITIGTQQFLTLDVVLEVGTIEETVNVTGAAPLIETANANSGTVLDRQALESLPSAGRMAFLMSTTVPTVVASGNSFWTRMQDTDGASAISLGGGGIRANNYLLDGVPLTDLTNRSIANPSMEALDDVRVQVHTFDAEMGRTGGGVFNAAAKSGSNQFRGSGFIETRPMSLMTNNFFDERNGIPMQKQHFYIAGGGVGGPIKRNRTFFYATAEKWYPLTVRNGNYQQPTARERNGDFSQSYRANGDLLVIYDPLTTRTDPATGKLVRDPFPGNVIPAGRINPVGKKALSYLPLPDIDESRQAGNFFQPASLEDRIVGMTTKIEHRFSDQISLSALYLHNRVSEPSEIFWKENFFASTTYMIERMARVLALNNTYLINSSTVLTLRGGFTQYRNDRTLPYPFDPSELGFNQTFLNDISLGKFPSFSFSGFEGMGFTGKQKDWQYSRTVNGTVSKLVGSHSLKFGGDYRVMGTDQMVYGNSSGTFAFTRQFTQGPNPQSPASASGSPIADAILGFPQSGSTPLPSPANVFVPYYSAYAQDDFRVSSNLTVNYGLRIEHEGGMQEVDDRISVGFDKNAISPLNSLVTLPVDPLTGQRPQVKGGLIYAGVNGAPKYQKNQPAAKLSPRAGVAWSIDSKNVVRGGYGIFWAPQYFSVSQSQVGYLSTTTLQQNSLIPITSIDNPFPYGLDKPSGSSLGLLTAVGNNVTFVDQDAGAPRVQQYAVDYQRDLPGAVALSIGYMGSRGNNLVYGQSSSLNVNQLPVEYLALGKQLVEVVPNPFFGVTGAGGFATRATIERGQLLRPFPQFLNVSQYQTTGAKSLYHALILQVSRRSTGWLGGRFSYTWSRLKDNQFGEGNYYSSSGTALDNYHPEDEYGLSGMDLTHKMVIAPMVRLPFGRGQRFLNNSTLLNAIVGGWSLSLVGTLESGFPIQMSQTPNNSGLFGSGQRPNVVPGADPLVPGVIRSRMDVNIKDNQYLNPDAWSLAPAYTFGNAPRSDPKVRTPWRNNLDISLAKQFDTGASTQTSLRVEILNATNTPQFAGSTTQLGSGAFGQLRSQGGYMRMVQITARFTF